MTDDKQLHVVGLSGGKDSSALALRLREVDPRSYVYLCTPTGNELPEMEDHWRNLARMLSQPILRLRADVDLVGLIERENMIPNWRARFCTRVLKIERTQEWIDSQVAAGHEVIHYVGLRADEEGREGGVYDNCTVRFPLREWGWGLHDVLAYLDQQGVTIPKRTDCAWCYYQKLPEWWELHRTYPDLYAEAEALEQRMGHTFRSPSRDSWPASLAELRERFERGEIPRNTDPTDDLFGFSANRCRVCSL